MNFSGQEGQEEEGRRENEGGGREDNNNLDSLKIRRPT